MIKQFFVLLHTLQNDFYSLNLFLEELGSWLLVPPVVLLVAVWLGFICVGGGKKGGGMKLPGPGGSLCPPASPGGGCCGRLLLPA